MGLSATTDKAKIEIVKFIRCADKNTPVDKWNNVVRNYGNNNIFQKLLINSPYIPEESLKILIEEKHLKTEYCLELLTKRELSESLIKRSIFPAVGINDLVSLTQKCYDEKIDMPDKNLFTLLDFCNENLIYNCLKNIHDENFLNNMIERNDPTEDHLTMIASNHFISDEIRNKAFDCGVNYLKVENPTIKMSDDLCDSWMGTIFDGVIDTRIHSEDVMRYACIRKLSDIVIKDKVSVNKLLELVTKCEENLNKNIPYIKELYMEIAKNSKYEDVINLCYDSSNQQIKTCAMSNINMNKDVAKAVADTLFPELAKASGNDYLHISSLISSLAHRTELSSYAYNWIFNNKPTEIQIEVAKSKTTPVSFLKALQRNRQNQQIVRTAEFNERLYKTGIITADEFSKILTAFSTKKNEGIVATDNVPFINDKERLKTVVAILKDIAEKTTTQNLQNNINFYIPLLEMYSNANREKMENALYKFDIKSNKFQPNYDIIPEMNESVLKENLNKFSKQTLQLIGKEISFDYFVAEESEQYKMFEAKEKLLHNIDEIFSEKFQNEFVEKIGQRGDSDGEEIR